MTAAAETTGHEERMAPADIDWGRLFDEPVESAEFVDVGYDNANDVWNVNTAAGRYVVKISRTERHRPTHPFWNGLFTLFGLHVHDDIERQAALARFVQQHSPLRIPRVRRADKSRAVLERPFTIIERLPGRPASLEGADATRIARQLGEHLGSVHRAAFDYWGVFEDEARRPLSEWPAALSSALGELAGAGFGDAARVERDLPRYQAHARALPAPERGALVFPDLKPSQFLADDAGLTALVDLESLVVAPRELDLIAVEYSLPPRHAREFAAGYEQHLPMPQLGAVRPLYRYAYYLVDILGETDYEAWMSHAICFDD